MIIVAIDGASRRNGKPDCLSTGSVFAKSTVDTTMHLIVDHEHGSTNQRGELTALNTGLRLGQVYDALSGDDGGMYLITDSEYVFNTINKGWYKNWRNKGWITGVGEPVKNRDMWEQAGEYLDGFEKNDMDFVCYHIKGHLLTMGKVTASQLLDKDGSGKTLYDAVAKKWIAFLVDYGHGDTKVIDALDHALALFQRNHGFIPEMDIFGQLVICNTVADLAAGYYADITDSK